MTYRCSMDCEPDFGRSDVVGDPYTPLEEIVALGNESWAPGLFQQAVLPFLGGNASEQVTDGKLAGRKILSEVRVFCMLWVRNVLLRK